MSEREMSEKVVIEMRALHQQFIRIAESDGDILESFVAVGINRDGNRPMGFANTAGYGIGIQTLLEFVAEMEPTGCERCDGYIRAAKTVLQVWRRTLDEEGITYKTSCR
jgi:hypothetical protein